MCSRSEDAKVKSAMGQAQSDEPEHYYECEAGDHISQDVTDLEINSKEASKEQQHEDQSTSNPDKSKSTTAADEGTKTVKSGSSKITNNNQQENVSNRQRPRQQQQQQQCQPTNNNYNFQAEHVRKLSIVSHRNIQLLSMKPRSDMDAYADELRGRRRSSLINLILGAPSSGPRFSDDLCSLSSHMSELCNFGIEFFPNYNPMCPTGPTNQRQLGPQPINCSLPFGGNYRSADWHQRAPHHLDLARSPSQASHKIVERLAWNNGKEVGGSGGGLGNVISGESRQEANLCRNELSHRRRRSSLGSLASILSDASTSAARNGPQTSPRVAPGDDGKSCLSSKKGDSVANDVGNNNTSSGNSNNNNSNQLKDNSRCLDATNDLATNIAAKTTTTSHHGEPNSCKQQLRRHPSLASTLKSIDLTSSFEQHDNSGPLAFISETSPPLSPSGNSRLPRLSTSSSSTSSSSGSSLKSKKTIFNITTSKQHQKSSKLTKPARLNQTGRLLRRSGSELSLYSTLSANSELQEAFGNTYINSNNNNNNNHRSYYNYNINENNRLHRESHGGVSISKAAHYYDDQDADLFKRVPAGSFKVNTKQTSSETQSSAGDPSRETKLIIMLQVCLPFILAGFGNMAAGLVLNQIAHWKAFKQVPVFFVLLPSFVGLKGNIEMTLASRLSTLSNLNLLDSSCQRRHAYVSNLILILSQAIGLSMFAAILSILCECLMTNNMTMMHAKSGADDDRQTPAPPAPLLATQTAEGEGVAVGLGGKLSELIVISGLVVLPSALVTAVVLVIMSSFVMSLAIVLANYIQVNPDNLSTLIAALYGDVSCVLTYGLFAELMYSLHQQGALLWPIAILGVALISYPALCYLAYRFKETHSIALTSMPPMLTGILVSMGSGAVLSLFVGRFSLIALYQPVVNGFGANLIAVQASRVSTWLWCKELRRVSIQQQLLEQQPPPGKIAPHGPLASFTPAPITSTTPRSSIKQQHFASKEKIIMEDYDDDDNNDDQHELYDHQQGSIRNKVGNFFKILQKLAKLILWSFFNPSPNSIAARLLLIMLIPAHTLYFFVIWLLSPANYVVITWQFYFVYISLCLVQVFILLSICEPLMTLLMKRHLDPDVFGISLLMALADLVGTLCLAGAFLMLARVGDVNAHK